MPVGAKEAGTEPFVHPCRKCGAVTMAETGRTNFKPHLTLITLKCDICGASALKEVDERGWNRTLPVTPN
jgi:transcription elongation factor Elf1